MPTPTHQNLTPGPHHLKLTPELREQYLTPKYNTHYLSNSTPDTHHHFWSPLTRWYYNLTINEIFCIFGVIVLVVMGAAYYFVVLRKSKIQDTTRTKRNGKAGSSRIGRRVPSLAGLNSEAEIYEEVTLTSDGSKIQRIHTQEMLIDGKHLRRTRATEHDDNASRPLFESIKPETDLLSLNLGPGVVFDPRERERARLAAEKAQAAAAAQKAKEDEQKRQAEVARLNAPKPAARQLTDAEIASLNLKVRNYSSNQDHDRSEHY